MPTRIRDGQTPTLDDLVITNRYDILQDISFTGALGKSDHATILIKLAISNTKATTQVQSNFRKANYSDMNNFFANIDWKEEF